MDREGLQKLIDAKACKEGIEWANRFETLEEAWNNCNDAEHMRWAIRRIKPNQKTCVELAVELAELVLPLFETKYPDDDRPRKAIEVAKCWTTADASWAAVRAVCVVNTANTITVDAVCAANAANYAADAAAFAAATACTYPDKQQICDIVRKHINPFKQNEKTSN